MKRYIPGLHSDAKNTDDVLEGIFLVRVDRVNYRWHPQKPFFLFSFAILEPSELGSRTISGRMYCTPKALWRFNWLLRDFGYNVDRLGRDEVDEKALIGLQGIVRTSRRDLAERSFLNLDGFAPAAEWDSLANQASRFGRRKLPMTFSYTQISQYLRCPRSYRYRYLDGWQQKDTRAAMVFGRCFEAALGAYFRREDPGAALFKEWGAYRDAPFDYRKGDTWDRVLHHGIHLLQRFAQDDRVQVVSPTENLQRKILKSLPGGNGFVAYIDALGKIDGQKCLIDWKTTTSSYPEGPSGLLALDPQLICYSWITGISDVALVVFVRKAHPEIQYLKTSITEQQREEFGQLAHSVIEQIERGEFLAHSGIRFPSNGCTSCVHLGLCLHQQDLIDTQLIRRPGASELDWIEQLSD